jgi:O-antigen/teichoic acid export membrane protein
LADDSARGEAARSGGEGSRGGAGRLRGLRSRFGWGLADQAVSSLTNFAVSLYVARTLGAVQFGAFSLAYVTYSFIINASRGLATDPLTVRFSGVDTPSWKKAVSSATGTATTVGLIAAAGMLTAGLLLQGTARAAFIAMGITMPGLMLQDAWRYAFFAHGKGAHAFLNDLIWALALAPALLALRMTGHQTVFWFVLAWGTSAIVAAAVGPFQARVIPRIHHTRTWITTHKDLALRYMVEESFNSFSGQVRAYGLAFFATLAAVGAVQAASTLMGPFFVIMGGISLVTVPEAARVLRHSPRHLRRFCVLLGIALSIGACAWGGLLLVALPRGLGQWLLHGLWRPAYPLLLPLTAAVIGACVTAGAIAGLRALGVARRSLRAEIITSALYIVFTLAGAARWGATGAVGGGAVATLAGAVIWWFQLHVALRESGVAQLALSGHQPGKHRLPPAAKTARSTKAARASRACRARKAKPPRAAAFRAIPATSPATSPATRPASGAATGLSLGLRTELDQRGEL